MILLPHPVVLRETGEWHGGCSLTHSLHEALTYRICAFAGLLRRCKSVSCRSIPFFSKRVAFYFCRVLKGPAPLACPRGNAAALILAAPPGRALDWFFFLNARGSLHRHESG
jgi:hypothetical protein